MELSLPSHSCSAIELSSIKMISTLANRNYFFERSKVALIDLESVSNVFGNEAKQVSIQK